MRRKLLGTTTERTHQKSYVCIDLITGTYITFPSTRSSSMQSLAVRFLSSPPPDIRTHFVFSSVRTVWLAHLVLPDLVILMLFDEEREL